MNRTFLLILTICIFTSCNYTSTKSKADVESKIDTTQKVLHVVDSFDITKIRVDSISRYNDSIAKIEKYQAFVSDSLIGDSLRIVAEDIKRRQNISITQRIKRINKLYRLMEVVPQYIDLNTVYKYDFLANEIELCFNTDRKFHIDECKFLTNEIVDYHKDRTESSYWTELFVDAYDLLANEIILLVTNKNIGNYNLDSLCSSAGDHIGVVHSEDNRLWVVSFTWSLGGNGYTPYNVIAWRDTCNKPQGFVSSYSETLKHIESLNWDKIYTLNNTDEKVLYLMLGSGFGTYAMIVELTHKGINLKYGGFQTKEIFNLYNTKAINGKNIVYNLGIDDGAVDNFNNYKFNKEKQTISFRKTSEYWRDDKKDTLTIGTLTFNGKYFTEKLKKQKYDINE